MSPKDVVALFKVFRREKFPLQVRQVISPRNSSLLAPHTSDPRGVPRCGALSLFLKTLQYRGDPAETAAGLNVKFFYSGTDWWW
jgi:hypothetical protein